VGAALSHLWVIEPMGLDGFLVKPDAILLDLAPGRHESHIGHVRAFQPVRFEQSHNTFLDISFQIFKSKKNTY
jgi:hypothetical protein